MSSPHTGQGGQADYSIVTGDCVEAMKLMQAESIDAVVTDPPYGTGEDDGGGYGRRELGSRGIANDLDLSALSSALPEMCRVLRAGGWLVVFASPRRQHEAGDILKAHCTLAGCAVWDKRMPGLGFPIRYSHEAILLAHTGDVPNNGADALLSVLSAVLPRATARQNHPHRKPIPLMAELVRWCCPPGGIVLDPFCGSGSTGVACIQEGRRFVGVELDPAWSAVASDRLAHAVPSLFHQPHIQQEIA